MKIENNIILITGGASGIGLGLAEALSKQGNKVLICGRREEKLRLAKERIPEIEAKRCDISKEEDCRALFDWAKSKNVNILINNAGVQGLVDFRKGTEDIVKNDDEISINFKAQVYLSALFVPEFMKKDESAIVNVSSGLGFVPLARYPIYSATKAAIHSFSMSLRHQLKKTPIKVFEIILPMVKDTELKRKQGITVDRGAVTADVIGQIVNALKNDTYEAIIGDDARLLINGSRSEKEEAFNRMNQY